jgi:hypothetical protein
VSPDVLRFLGPVLEWVNISGGNTDLLGGAEGADKTATEYAGMQANANTVMEDMKRTHHAFEEGVSRDVMWQVHHDPFMQDVLPVRIPGTEGMEVEYSWQTREGDFDDFVMKIRPGTMAAQDPNVRARRLNEWLAIFLPTGAINPLEAAKVTGEQLGVEDMDRMVMDPAVMMEQQMLYGGVPPDGQGMPGQQVQQPGYVGPPGQSRGAPGRQQGGNGPATNGINEVRGAMAVGVGA